MNIKFRGDSRGGLKAKLATLTTIVAISGAAVFMPYAALAQSTADVIAQLQAQIAALTAQLATLSGQPAAAPAAGGKCAFTRSLTMGTRGDDVMCLQKYLTGTGHYTYSGGATGFFGSVTKAAVMAWQKANSVSPAVGYFGTLSRAKYDSMVVAVAPPAPKTGGTVVVPAGSGLTVTAPVGQPEATLAPGSASRLPFVKAIFTASADGDVTVKSVTVERRSLADDVNFDGLLLLDENGNQIGTTKTLTSEHKVVFTESFVVKAGTSKVMTVAANMVAAGSIQAGQIAKLAIVAVDAGTSAVNASLPIEGNGMTMNSTLTIGSVTMSIGSLDPGAANTKDVGTKGYYLASVKAAVGSAEDVSFQQIRWNQAGSAAKSDITNVMVKAGDKDYPAEITSDGKYWVAKFPDGLNVEKGANKEFSIKADFLDGSARTVDMDILKKADIVVKGKTFGYNIVVSGGSSGAASAGAFSSNQEPFFNAYASTINKGSILVSSSNVVASGNVPIDVADTTLGAFTFDVKGEPSQFTNIVLNFTFTGTGTSSNVTNVKLYDNKTGSIAAGPKDPASGIVTWTDTWTAPVGLNTYVVKGRLSTTFVTNDTVQVGMNPSNMTVKGAVTGLTISPTPTSLINANNQTVKGAALAISVSPTPFAQNVIANTNLNLFATYIFDATQSGEDVRVSSIQLRDTVDATGRVDEVNSCQLFDGSTSLNTGSDVVNPSDPSSGTTNDVTFTLTNNLIITKGTVKRVDLKCNVSSSAAGASTHAWGTNAAAANISSSGAQTGTSITETITTGTGQLMTVRTAGSYTVVKDGSAPSSSLVIAGKIEVPMNVLKFHANDEAISITDITLTFSTSTASTTDFSKVTLWDGATQVGTVVWSGATNVQNATTTLIVPFVIPKDGDKLMTLKADLGTISVTASTTAGRLLAIDYSGISSTTGSGQSSGARLGSLSGNNTAGASMQIMKTIPTVDKVAVSTTSITPGDNILYRFKVKADAAGPVALYKFTFIVSSSTVSATTSNFRLYGYTDSAFSLRAYDNNPISLNNVDCVGQTNFEDRSGTACGSSVGSNLASTSEVVFFFDPVANVASTTEAIQIAAGDTRYFELRGDIANPGAGTGNSFSVRLDGDAARVTRVRTGTADIWGATTGACYESGRGFLCTAQQIGNPNTEPQNDFVWSPMSTSTTLTNATSTPDWTNGFLLPGLPATGLSANTFSN